jgi:hypothetical protein
MSRKEKVIEPCKNDAHDWAGIMILGIQYAQECRHCQSVLLDAQGSKRLFGALHDFIEEAQGSK